MENFKNSSHSTQKCQPCKLTGDTSQRFGRSCEILNIIHKFNLFFLHFHVINKIEIMYKISQLTLLDFPLSKVCSCPYIQYIYKHIHVHILQGGVYIYMSQDHICKVPYFFSPLPILIWRFVMALTGATQTSLKNHAAASTLQAGWSVYF